MEGQRPDKALIDIQREILCTIARGGSSALGVEDPHSMRGN